MSHEVPKLLFPLAPESDGALRSSVMTADTRTVVSR
jgi:hypothetical protein